MKKPLRPHYCMCCDNGTVMIHGCKAVEVKTQGRKKVLPKVKGWHCPACGEVEFDAGEAQRYGALLAKTGPSR